MKKSKFTEEQILFALKQADAGQPVGDVCRQMGISEATFCVWKKRYGNLGLLEVRELRQLRDENARLKRLVADLTLDRHILQDVVKKRFSGLPAPRYCTMDTRLLSVERAAVLPAHRLAGGDVVLPPVGTRCDRTTTAVTRAGNSEAAVRVRTSAHFANSRGLEGRPEQSASAVQAGGPPGAYESATKEAHQPAPRSLAHSAGGRTVLGHGLRPRSACQWSEVPRTDDHRQVASTVCGAAGGFLFDGSKCHRCVERGGAREIFTLCDNCRPRNGIYVQSARRVVLFPRREARLHPTRQTHRERNDRVV